MKKYTIVLFALLCIFVYCSGDDEENYDYDYDNDSECDKKESASKATECNKLKVGDDYQYCCYMHYTMDGEDPYKGCIEITKEEYKDIKKYISEAEDKYNVKIKKLDCNSAHLEIGLLSLLLILF